MIKTAMRPYTFKQIQTFMEVARQRSVSKAAERLFVTQPAVSMQLRQLEDAFGLALVEPQGRNIRLNLPVTLKEAVLGAKVKVPTPEGPVMVSIPKGSSSGKVLRLKGRGFMGKDGKRGDQLVCVTIDLPGNDPALQQFAEGWTGGGNPRSGLGV